MRGHVAFRLEMLSGEFTGNIEWAGLQLQICHPQALRCSERCTRKSSRGIPDIGVLGSCGASSRCKVQLQQLAPKISCSSNREPVLSVLELRGSVSLSTSFA